MQDFCFLLKEGEQILYSAKSTGHLHARKVIYILLALFFVAVGLFIYSETEATPAAGIGAICLGVLFIIPLIYEIARSFKTHYLLTNQRAIIVEQPVWLGKPVVFSFPWAEDMIKRYKRHRNGSADFIFAKEPFGSITSVPVGFINAPNADVLHQHFHKLGIFKPENNVSFKKLPKIQHPGVLKRLFGYLLGTLALGYLACAAIINNGTDLHLFGMEHDALVIGNRKATEKRGKEKLTLYYPIVVYQSTNAKEHTTLSLNGSDTPLRSGDTITILANESNPKRVILADNAHEDTRALAPCLGALFCLVMFIITCIRSYLKRKEPYHHVVLNNEPGLK